MILDSIAHLDRYDIPCRGEIVSFLKKNRPETLAGTEIVIKGRDLFLIDAVGATETLRNAARVAHGYTGTTLKAPLAPNGKLYLRLRDAPDDVVILPVG